MGLRNATGTIARGLLGPRFVTHAVWEYRKKLGFVSQYRRLLHSKYGLEIGGPSHMLARDGPLPIYDVLAGLDNCLYSGSTIWTGEVQAGNTFSYDRAKEAGKQIICDSTDLHPIKDSAYDCVLACHCVEHIANPLRALGEWKRVLQENGLLFVVLPHKDGGFDWRRPVTSLTHLIDDFRNGIGEEDLTHLPEILELHDLSKDPGAGTKENFRERSLQNYKKRALHHHVFDTRTAFEMLDHRGFELIRVDFVRPIHLIILARRVNGVPDNDEFLKTKSRHLRRSPFASDHQSRMG